MQILLTTTTTTTTIVYTNFNVGHAFPTWGWNTRMQCGVLLLLERVVVQRGAQSAHIRQHDQLRAIHTHF